MCSLVIALLAGVAMMILQFPVYAQLEMGDPVNAFNVAEINRTLVEGSK